MLKNSAFESMESYTPKQIVEELDRFIIGQHKAKRSVAIALRNRWRRQQVSGPLQNEIHPKNIIMIGPTGVGKTEIARRLSKLAKAPFIKVEASKFTEVGYVGRDVESMIRDLAEISVQMVRLEEQEANKEKAREKAESLILAKLFEQSSAQQEKPAYEIPSTSFSTPAFQVSPDGIAAPMSESENDDTQTDDAQDKVDKQEQRRQNLRAGDYDDMEIEVDVQENSMPMMQVFSNAGLEEMGINMQDLFDNTPFGKKNVKKKKTKVKYAFEIILEQESQKLVDKDKVQKEALHRVEQSGIVFIDEIDKIASRETAGRSGPDVSREGVQRDILPIVEGSTVTTKYGIVHTDHILFIAAGAFHFAKVSDLIPELQGRFPIRVELDSLTENDFLRILTEPDNSLVKQYTALMDTEKISLDFSDDALLELSRMAASVNNKSQNIGARRLHTVMEKLLDDLSFDAPDKQGETISIDLEYVSQQLQEIIEDEDLSRYIL